MFGFRKKKKAEPALCPANPGVGSEANIAFSNSERTWNEKVNLVELAAQIFSRQGLPIASEKTWLEHVDSGFTILPRIAGLEPQDDGGVQTVTTIQVNHPELVPAGTFEFQHSVGDSTADAILKGFDQWLQMDFATLLDALRSKPENSTLMELEFPAADGKPARKRRAVLGPPSRCVQKPPATEVADDHPFCHCCLLTNSFAAFKELMDGDDFFGLRLFAARDSQGELQADCRVNGEDWERGKQALREYVATWPEAGFEFRKQYVILHTPKA